MATAAPDSGNVSREFIECDAPGCGKSGPPKQCARCKSKYYCNIECQKKDWRVHKPYCPDVERMRNDFAGIGAARPCDATMETSLNKECPICFAEPIDDPFIIPGCSHAFCFECLRRHQDVVKKSIHHRLSEQEQQLTCPYCRSEVPDIGGALTRSAMLYVARAGRSDLAPEEKKENQELALAEIEKVLGNDSDDCQALFVKAEILLMMDRPDDAIETLEKILEADARTRDRVEEIKVLHEQYMTAFRQGQDDLAEQLTQQAMEISEKGVDRLLNLYDIYLEMAEALQAKGDWRGSAEIYQDKMLSVIKGPGDGTPPQHRQMWMGLSRCMYEMGEYDHSIASGEAALEMNRLFPGVHKYVALSQKAKGDLEAARRTMSRAVLYETPWDEWNKANVKQLWHELMDVSR